MKRVALCLLVTLSLLLPWSPVRADITICNDFRAPISIAIAYEERTLWPRKGGGAGVCRLTIENRGLSANRFRPGG